MRGLIDRPPDGPRRGIAAGNKSRLHCSTDSCSGISIEMPFVTFEVPERISARSAWKRGWQKRRSGVRWQIDRINRDCFVAASRELAIAGGWEGPATVSAAAHGTSQFMPVFRKRARGSIGAGDPRPAPICAGLYSVHSMANLQHLAIVKQGVGDWNEWRAQNKSVTPDLSGAELSGINLDEANLCEVNLHKVVLHEADLRGASLIGADLRGADLRGANASKSYLYGADLRLANLSHAYLISADLGRADLRGTDLSQANLNRANLSDANLGNAKLIGAELDRANLISTNFDGADLTDASIFGISVWDVSLEGTIQKNLRIKRYQEDSPITLDDLEVAQFIYLLLNNKRIRNVIDTITSKVVLILGRFTPERKTVLDALREQLRRCDYLPVLFDFETPLHRDITETVSTLAHMARFVIADITDAKSIPQELLTIVPNLPSVPVQPVLLASQKEYGMFEHFRRFPWVLEPVLYEDQDRLLTVLAEKVIGPAEAKAKEQTKAALTQ